jgi:alpha-tubulin suppressor-like RCC1 family protein
MRLWSIACVAVVAACSSSGPSGPAVRQEAPNTIVAGNATTCLLTTAGAAYCWGADSSGLLGIGDTTHAQLTPAPVVGGQVYSAMSGNESFRCALSSGQPWCWGQTLVRASVTAFADTMPTQITGAALATIAAGPWHACGLTSSGTAYCWGNNFFGQLGVGDTLPHTGPVAVSSSLHFSAISVGFWHTCALTTNGAAYCWGYNAAGELGTPPATAQQSSTPIAVGGGQTFASISAGSLYTCGVTPAGAAYCWGWNQAGNVGDSTDTNRTAPTPVVQTGLTFATVIASNANTILPTTCGITTAGAAYCWGTATRQLSPLAVPGGLTFATLSVGLTHACGVTTSSAAYCWGKNDYGELGDGTTQASTSPVAVSGSLTAKFSRRASR